MLCTKLPQTPSVLSLDHPVFIGTILGAKHMVPNKTEKAFSLADLLLLWFLLRKTHLKQWLSWFYFLISQLWTPSTDIYCQTQGILKWEEAWEISFGVTITPRSRLTSRNKGTHPSDPNPSNGQWENRLLGNWQAQVSSHGEVVAKSGPEDKRTHKTAPLSTQLFAYTVILKLGPFGIT